MWDAESGQEQSRLAGLVWATGSDWSPVEDLVAVGGHDSIVHIWDMVTGQEVTKLSGTTQPGYLAFSPGGERLLAVGYSHNVNIYNLSEACVNISITTHGGISLPAWSPGGEQIAFGWGFSGEGWLKIWETTNGKRLMDLSDEIGMPGYLAWSPLRRSILNI